MNKKDIEKSKWLKFCRWLRKKYPLQYPVEIRTVKAKKNDGTTNFDGEVFRIRIREDQDFGPKIDSLTHEWAHCLTWFGAEQDEEHSSEWGIAQAAIYREYLKLKFLWTKK